jgi:fructosamine-3-kinase
VSNQSAFVPQEVQLALEEECGFTIADVTPVSGGCISSAAVVVTHSGKGIFLKWNDAHGAEFFEAEAEGLRVLSSADALRIPEVLGVNSPSNYPFIALELLSTGKITEEAEVRLGHLLAKQHQTLEKRFGFESDNFIGASKQVNSWSEDWGEFFVAQRLGVQIELAEEAGWLTSAVKRSFTNIERALIKFLNIHTPEASLVHGDLWSGNVFWSNTGPAVIDPAVYYGDAEVDIAFTRMFGGFGSSFYKEYFSCRPPRKGIEQRVEIYNLYHLLNHANLFSGSYVSSSIRQIESLHGVFL